MKNKKKLGLCWGVVAVFFAQQGFVSAATGDGQEGDLSWRLPENSRILGGHLIEGFSNSSRNNLRSEAMEFQEILNVTSEAMEGVSHIRVYTDERGDCASLGYLTTENYRLNFTSDDLIRGVTLFKSGGRNILILRSKEKLDPQKGGKLELSYLYNGVFNEYRSFPMRLIRLGNGWSLEKPDRTRFSNMKINPNSFLGMVSIGIESIDVW